MNTQYKVEIYNYTPEGSVGSLFTTRYIESVEEAKNFCAEYENIYQTKEQINPETGETEIITTPFKAYQIRLYLLCYKLCEDRAAFFNQFQA